MSRLKNIRLTVVVLVGVAVGGCARLTGHEQLVASIPGNDSIRIHDLAVSDDYRCLIKNVRRILPLPQERHINIAISDHAATRSMGLRIDPSTDLMRSLEGVQNASNGAIRLANGNDAEWFVTAIFGGVDKSIGVNGGISGGAVIRGSTPTSVSNGSSTNVYQYSFVLQPKAQHRVLQRKTVSRLAVLRNRGSDATVRRDSESLPLYFSIQRELNESFLISKSLTIQDLVVDAMSHLLNIDLSCNTVITN